MSENLKTPNGQKLYLQAALIIKPIDFWLCDFSKELGYLPDGGERGGRNIADEIISCKMSDRITVKKSRKVSDIELS